MSGQLNPILLEAGAAVAEANDVGWKLDAEQRAKIIELAEAAMAVRDREFGGSDVVAKSLNRMLEPNQLVAMDIARSIAINDGREGVNPFIDEKLQKAYASEQAFERSKFDREAAVVQRASVGEVGREPAPVVAPQPTAPVDEINSIEETRVRGFADRVKEWASDVANRGSVNAAELAAAAEAVEEKNRDEHRRRQEQQATPKDAAPEKNPLASRKTSIELERQAIIDHIHREYRGNDQGEFSFKSGPERVAFRDRGAKLTTSLNDEKVAFAMAAMAQAKGWTNVTVTGNDAFKREMWIEASTRGMKVSGYTPTEQDRKDLDAKRVRAERNSVEATSGRDRGSKLPDREPAAGKPREPNASERSKKSTERVVTGTLLEHGAAPYQNVKDGKPSYFVKVETTAGVKVLWGADLKRAMTEVQAKTGAELKIEMKGKEPVAVTEAIKDKEGKVTGYKEVATKLNRWEVTQAERKDVASAVLSAAVDSKIKDPGERLQAKSIIDARLEKAAKAGKLPAIEVYDKAAPAQVKEPARDRPPVEREAERSR